MTIDTSSPTEWSHPTKIWKDADCPSCGYDGGGHITVFVKEQIGRRCLECRATWPIETKEPLQKPMLGWIGNFIHPIKLEPHPNAQPGVIGLQVLATAPCGAQLDHLPMLAAEEAPTCPECLKAGG